MRDRFLLLLCVCALVVLGCRADRPEAAASEQSVGEQKARQIVLMKYRALFADKFFESHDGKHHRFPPLEEAAFKDVEAVGDAWLVRATTFGGVNVTGRVAKNGQWAEINAVKYESE